MKLSALLLTGVLMIAGSPALADSLPPGIAAAAADPARAADKALDARRHGPELMAFAHVKAGDKVLELIPGSGYFTRLFSRVTNGQGSMPPFGDQLSPKEIADVSAYVMKAAAK